MKFKENYFTRMLAERGIDAAELMQELNAARLFDGCHDDYLGGPLADYLDGENRWEAFEAAAGDIWAEADALQRAWIENLTLHGEGICPECGSDNCMRSERGYNIGEDGRDTYVGHDRDWRCYNCGHEWDD